LSWLALVIVLVTVLVIALVIALVTVLVIALVIVLVIVLVVRIQLGTVAQGSRSKALGRSRIAQTKTPGLICPRGLIW
jgi:hypothetical protein